MDSIVRVILSGLAEELGCSRYRTYRQHYYNGPDFLCDWAWGDITAAASIVGCRLYVAVDGGRVEKIFDLNDPELLSQVRSFVFGWIGGIWSGRSQVEIEDGII